MSVDKGSKFPKTPETSTSSVERRIPKWLSLPLSALTIALTQFGCVQAEPFKDSNNC